MKKILKLSALFILSITASPLALAHPGHGADMFSFSGGFMHPITGLDHVSVMLAVGFLAVMMSGKSVWQMPLAFIGLMLVGAVLGASGVVMPGVEIFIAASVIVFGLLLASGMTLSKQTQMMQKAVLGMVMGFAVFHGLAHGAEMPVTASVVQYFVGFTLATAVLHLSGIGIGKKVSQMTQSKRISQYTGMLMTVLGSLILFS